MSNKFCDTKLATGGNDGSTMDDAYQNIDTAIESALAAGDKLYIRRRSNLYNPTSHISITRDGNLRSPISIIGCPRNEKKGVATFTQGSNIISAVSFDPAFGKYGARMIRNDIDARDYMISAIAHKIDYDNKSGDFTEGLMVTGAGGCEGKIHKLVDNGDGTGSLWIVSRGRELIDRGNCEDIIAPMLVPEITPVVSLGTYERSAEQVYEGDHSWKITKTSGVGGGQTSVYLQKNTNIEMHGFKAGSRYRLSFMGYCDEVTNPHGMQIYEYHDAAWNFKGNFLFANVLTWENKVIDWTLNSGTTGVWVRFIISSNSLAGSYIFVDNVSIKNVFSDGEVVTDEDTGVADVDGTPIDDGFVILNNYAGATATGALTIEKDEDYDDFQLIDDNAWTIKKTDWNADDDDLPIIDFGDTAYRFNSSAAYYWVFKNLYWKNGTSYTFYIISFSADLISHCLFFKGFGAQAIYAYHDTICLTNVVIVGVYANNSYGFMMSGQGPAILKNVASYNHGYAGFRLSDGTFDNVNSGIELPNASTDLWLAGEAIRCRDFKMGGKNGYAYYYKKHSQLNIENYQRVLKEHKTLYISGYNQKTDVVPLSGDPYKRSGGADSVIEVSCATHVNFAPTPDEWKYLIFEHEYEVDLISRNYKYYVQCKALSVTASQLYLECSYIDQYVNSATYHTTEVRSGEACALRTGVDDWSQYLEVVGIKPAIDGRVRIKCFISFYDADGAIFIDPKVKIN